MANGGREPTGFVRTVDAEAAPTGGLTPHRSPKCDRRTRDTPNKEQVMPRRIKHIAFFKFQPECTAAEIAEVWRLIEDLPKRIPGILDFTWGPNVSSEGLDQGFTHSFVIWTPRSKDNLVNSVAFVSPSGVDPPGQRRSIS